MSIGHTARENLLLYGASPPIFSLGQQPVIPPLPKCFVR